jgi:tRNA (guanine37-N1)-methyltransferase
VELANGLASQGPVPSPKSHATSRCLLDYPHYTRPPSFRGWDVPETLLSGNHEQIRKWRRQKAVEKTQQNRPDLLGSPNEVAEESRKLPRI